MTSKDTINMPSIGQRKTAVFVIISDKDRSLDGYANLFISQTMDELCRYADDRCKNGELKVPVRFILDDFATGLADVAVIEKEPKVEGKSMTMFLTEKR